MATDKKQNIHSTSTGTLNKRNWKNTFKRVMDKIKADNVSIVAAGVAFYFFLALFPALAAVVSIYGLAVEPGQVKQQLSQVAEALPKEAFQMISNTLTQIASRSNQALNLSLIISILFSLWSANKATTALFEGVNIAYHETDNRSFLKKKGITLLFTLGVIITGIIAVAFVVGFPAIIDKLDLPGLLKNVLALLRWIILAGIIYFVLVILYKVAPDRKGQEFKWINPGALFATVLWLAGSLLFTMYINNFGNYDKTYGSIAAVIILLLWFYLTGFIILTGAEINSVVEQQASGVIDVETNKISGGNDTFWAERSAHKSK